MTPDALSALHRRCFTTPRPYTASEFAGVLGGLGAFLITRPHGFILARLIADEVELLTLAVDPDHRRTGVARDLMGEFIGTSHRLGGRMAFLDVAADNNAAQALYDEFGFREIDRRLNYYKRPDKTRLDAIMMMRDL